MKRRLFYFNPTCEMAVVNGQVSYMPPARLKRFEEDLETIPMWLAGVHDCVLLRNHISGEYCNYLEDLGFQLPAFITSCNDLGDQTIHELHPWGWSPVVHQKLDNFQEQMDACWKVHPMSDWKNSHRILLSRLTGLEILEKVCEIHSEEHDLIRIPRKPVVLHSLQEVKDLGNVIPPPALIKTPWSASGRGLFKIRNEAERAEDNQWVRGKIRQQGCLLAEPFLEKVQDVSFHFRAGAEGYQFLGSTFFTTDSAGQFISCYTYPPKNINLKRIPVDTAIAQAVDLLIKVLERMNLKEYYQGPIGVDGLFYLHSGGKISLHPCIEVNLRYTMGLVNLCLSDRLHPGCKGQWKIVTVKRKEWLERSGTHQPNMVDGLLAGGTIALTPPPLEEGFMVILELV